MLQIATLTVLMPASPSIAQWVLLATATLWWLPDWLRKWLDVRDRWKGPGA